MKVREFTRLNALLTLAIAAILAVILYPTVRFDLLRPPRFYTIPLPPQRFRQAQLQAVLARLDREFRNARIQRRKIPLSFLKVVRWEKESLKHRRVTLGTTKEGPLKEVLARVERAAKIRFDYGGWCANCGWPDGGILIRDALTASKRDRVHGPFPRS